MRVLHNNFLTLPANARELSLAVQNDEELNDLLSCVITTQGNMLSNIH